MTVQAEKHAASYHLVRQLCSKTRRRTIETTSVSSWVNFGCCLI